MQNMAGKKIILLAGEGFSTQVVYNAVNDALGIHHVIIEAPVDKKTFIQRRIKKLGLPKVVAQIMFQFIVVPLLNIFSKKRVEAIKQLYQLNNKAIPETSISRVFSVNSDATITFLQQLQPDLVIVNGTRIISEKILASVQCKFINMHAGITPAYRGVHGVYWALVNKDAAHAGVTIHLVDPGIDTGNVLYQSIVTFTSKDNFTTYPILQLGVGTPLLIKAAENILANNVQIIEGTKESKLWSHPGIFEYLYSRIFRKVK